MQMAVSIGADGQQQINHGKSGWQGSRRSLAVPLPLGSISSFTSIPANLLLNPAVMGTKHCPKALKSSWLLESTL